MKKIQIKTRLCKKPPPMFGSRTDPVYLCIYAVAGFSGVKHYIQAGSKEEAEQTAREHIKKTLSNIKTDQKCKDSMRQPLELKGSKRISNQTNKEM